MALSRAVDASARTEAHLNIRIQEAKIANLKMQIAKAEKPE
jgi:hypothetical protein